MMWGRLFAASIAPAVAIYMNPSKNGKGLKCCLTEDNTLQDEGHPGYAACPKKVRVVGASPSCSIESITQEAIAQGLDPELIKQAIGEGTAWTEAAKQAFGEGLLKQCGSESRGGMFSAAHTVHICRMELLVGLVKPVVEKVVNDEQKLKAEEEWKKLVDAKQKLKDEFIDAKEELGNVQRRVRGAQDRIAEVQRSIVRVDEHMNRLKADRTAALEQVSRLEDSSGNSAEDTHASDIKHLQIGAQQAGKALMTLHVRKKLLRNKEKTYQDEKQQADSEMPAAETRLSEAKAMWEAQ